MILLFIRKLHVNPSGEEFSYSTFVTTERSDIMEFNVLSGHFLSKPKRNDSAAPTVSSSITDLTKEINGA